jgi:AcrR family transcriptional regulator
MRAVDPPTAVDLDELEALKSRILYFERLASHFFSFMWLACLLLLAATVAIVVDALLADFKRGALTSDTIYQSASLVLLTAVFLAGVLAATLAYARSVNSAQSRSVRTARKLAALAVLLIVLVFGYLIDWDGAQAALFWRQFRAFFMAPVAHSTAVAEIVLLVGATLVPQYYYHVSHHTLMRLTGEQAFVLRENPDQAFATRLFRTAVGIPRIVDYMPTRRGRATLLFMLANACYALSTAFFMVGTIILLVHLVTVQESCNGGADARCVAESGVLFLSWSVLSCLAAFVVAPLIGARIIAAARALFTHKGFGATTTQEIAEAAGVASGTVFTYANTKDDLLILVFHNEMMDVVEKAFRASRLRTGLLEQSLAFFQTLVAYHLRDPALAHALMRQLGYVASADQRALVSELMVSLLGRLGELVEAAKAKGEVAAGAPLRASARSLFAIYYYHLGAMLSGYLDRTQFDRVLRTDLGLLLTGLD